MSFPSIIYLFKSVPYFQGRSWMIVMANRNGRNIFIHPKMVRWCCFISSQGHLVQQYRTAGWPKSTGGDGFAPCRHAQVVGACGFLGHGNCWGEICGKMNLMTDRVLNVAKHVQRYFKRHCVQQMCFLGVLFLQDDVISFHHRIQLYLEPNW